MARMATPFKHPDSGIYYIRIGVPADMQELMGTNVFKKSLRTKDFPRARELFIAEQAKLEERYRQHREGTKLSRKDIEVLAHRWLEKAITELETKENFEDYLISFINEGEELVDAMDDLTIMALESEYTEQLALVGSEVEKLLADEGAILAKDTELYKSLVNKVCLKRLHLSRTALARCTGDWITKAPNETSLSNHPLSTEHPIDETRAFKPLGDVVAAYLEHKIASESWGEDVEADVIATLNVFLGVHPAESNPDKITRQQFREFRDLLAQSPKAYGTKKEFKGLCLPDVVALGKKREMEAISPTTLNKKAGYVAALFKFATQERFNLLGTARCSLFAFLYLGPEGCVVA